MPFSVHFETPARLAPIRAGAIFKMHRKSPYFYPRFTRVSKGSYSAADLLADGENTSCAGAGRRERDPARSPSTIPGSATSSTIVRIVSWAIP